MALRIELGELVEEPGLFGLYSVHNHRSIASARRTQIFMSTGFYSCMTYTE